MYTCACPQTPTYLCMRHTLVHTHTHISLTQACLPFTCGYMCTQNTQICTQNYSPTWKYPSTHIPFLTYRLKACSSLHFLLLTYLHFKISPECTHSLLQAYPLLHTHCHTPTYRLNHFLSSFLFPIPVSFIPTHTVILASPLSLSLSLSPTQFVSWFPTGWAIATFLAHVLIRQEVAYPVPIPRTPSMFPTSTWDSPSAKAATGPEEFSADPEAHRRDGSGQGGFAPLSPDLLHVVPTGERGCPPNPGHLQLWVSQDLW